MGMLAWVDRDVTVMKADGSSMHHLHCGLCDARAQVHSRAEANERLDAHVQTCIARTADGHPSDA